MRAVNQISERDDFARLIARQLPTLRGEGRQIELRRLHAQLRNRDLPRLYDAPYRLPEGCVDARRRWRCGQRNSGGARLGAQDDAVQVFEAIEFIQQRLDV